VVRDVPVRPPRWRARLAALALALAPAGCARDPAGALRIASVEQPATSLVFLARSAGCVDRERLRLDERTFELGRDAIEELRAGRADAAVAYEFVVARAARAPGGDRLRVVAALHRSTRNTRLVADARAGISAFADLAGKRVGLPRGTNAEFFADVVLRFGGVDRATVRLEDLAPEGGAAALAAGRIDAAVLFDPFAAAAERALGERARTLTTPLYEEFSLLVTRSDVLAARAPALRSLVRALACADRVARERPEAALAEVRRRFPAFDEAELRAQLGRVTWSIAIDHVLVETLREQAEWLSAAGVDGAAPRALVHDGLLREVASAAVLLLPGTGDGG
jgi:NitT/TauT family transport system substrate-binding protein